MANFKFIHIQGPQGLYKIRLRKLSFLDNWFTDVFREYIEQDQEILNIGKKEEGWSPTFGDSERQIASVLVPALRCHSDCVYLELPYESKKKDRRFKNKDRHYLDYWVYDRDKRRTLGIEVKETWQSIFSVRAIGRMAMDWGIVLI